MTYETSLLKSLACVFAAVLAFAPFSEAVGGHADRYLLDTGIFSSCATDNFGVQCWGYPPVRNPPGGGDITDLRTASYQTNCLISSGTLRCWGGSGHITPIPSLQSPYAVDVHDAAACALDATGIVCWGDLAHFLTPTPTVDNPKDIALSYAGNPSACVLSDSGVTCWGDNTSGQINVPPLANPRQISVGAGHACAVDDTGVVCWGANSAGQATVPPLVNPKQVSAGGAFTCAVDDTGVVCWGVEGFPPCNIRNCGGPGYDYGQTRPPTLINPFRVAAGYSQVCALDATGAVCWGRNLHGEADNRHLDFDLSPVAEVIIPQGTPQECQQPGGTDVLLQASFEADPGDPILTYEWYIDDFVVGSGSEVTTLVALGNHSIRLAIRTQSGEEYVGYSSIEIVDTQKPALEVRFLDGKGYSITEVTRAGLNFIEFDATASDACDENPTIEAFGGVELSDGQVIRVQASVEDIILESSALAVGVSAEDQSGNREVQEHTLTVVD